MKIIEHLSSAASSWVADHPMSLPGRLAALRFGRPAGPPAPVLAPADVPINVLIAPANYAGQAHAWAQALERYDARVRAQNFSVSAGSFAFVSDAVIDPATYHNSREWQRRQLDEARRFSHLLIEAFQPPFGRLLRRDLKAQMQAVSPTSIALMCHGTDIRLPSAHRSRTPWSPLSGSGSAVQRLEMLAERNLKLVDSHPSIPVFVSTPDLLEDAPRAYWCPVVVETEVWRADPAGGSDVPVVVHAPSKPGVKGTEHIDPVLARLDDEGVITYQRIQGVPHDQMPGVLRNADMLVDQFGLGSYGVAACEAMAANCTVISHVTDTVRRIVEDETGLSLPIVEADPRTLEHTIRALASDAALREEHARQGLAYVSAVHDGRRSARILMNEWIERHTW